MQGCTTSRGFVSDGLRRQADQCPADVLLWRGTLRTIARLAAVIADAELSMVGILVNDGQDVLVEMAVGEQPTNHGPGFRLAVLSLEGNYRAGSLPGTCEPAGQLPTDLASVVEPGPMMVVPLLGSSDVLGVLTVVRASGRTPFTSSDLEMGGIRRPGNPRAGTDECSC